MYYQELLANLNCIRAVCEIVKDVFNIISDFNELLNLSVLISNSFHNTRRFLLFLWTYTESGLHLDTLHPMPPLEALITRKLSYPGNHSHVLSPRYGLVKHNVIAART